MTQDADSAWIDDAESKSQWVSERIWRRLYGNGASAEAPTSGASQSIRDADRQTAFSCQMKSGIASMVQRQCGWPGGFNIQ
jgi:hypothetical protein